MFSKYDEFPPLNKWKVPLSFGSVRYFDTYPSFVDPRVLRGLDITASTARFRSFPPTAVLVGRALRTGFGRCKRRPAGVSLEKFRTRDFGGRFGGVRVRPSG